MLENNRMNEILDILKTIKPEIDFENSNNFIDNGLLDSLNIITLISKLEENYSIKINPEDIDPDNFNSIISIKKLIDKYLI